MRAILFLAALSASAQDAIEVLSARCWQCHTSKLAMSGLDLTTREAALKGGSRGASVVPGDTGASLIIQAVERKGKLIMPPAAPLAASEIEVLRRWVETGARWPKETAVKEPSWWAFRKPVRPKSGNKIDDFLQAGLKAAGLQPSPQAGKAALAKRLYYDLHGLPPTAEQVQEFLRDSYENQVEKLLASPRYGEKWGRHWLDLVRYSDTAGFELDSYIADAWRYRDWVIRSFNEDKPYDRFIREQLAGDEVAPEDPVAQTGTGFFCVGPNRDMFPDQADINRVETLTDFVDTTAGVFQGLTFGCARCHDHKYDPIPQRDYYRLQAVFAPAVKVRVPLSRLDSLGWERQENVYEIRLREIGEQIGRIQERCKKEGKAGDEKIRACLNENEAGQLKAVEKELVRMFTNYRAKPFACGVTDVGDYSPNTVIPGKGEEVKAGFPSALGGGDIPEQSFERPTTGPIPLTPTTGRRKALADWIASKENPLTARVMVNRIWQYHFGRGIVATPSDFGTRGRAPSHPELLDWLAVEFMQRGWSVKAMHRLILHSAVYKQAAQPSKPAREKDPENIWLSHFRRRRLDAEELRDAVLAATGRLNLKEGGRAVVPPLSEEELFNLIGKASEQWIVTGDESEHTRRSVYLFQKRTFRLPMLEVFDAPESMLTCSRREVSTTAPQALTFLNGAFVMKQARAFGAELAEKHDAELVQAAWIRVLAREPAAAEAEQARGFLVAQQKELGSRQAAAVELVRALLNSNEFAYVD
ncbi:MAG: DUF1553 domain-containing protein [Acidimicrobiia bacterium]|nr:DUF1553 domain-containing protein [Acidimicrobiia bacterium]